MELQAFLGSADAQNNVAAYVQSPWLQAVMGRFLSHKPGRSGNFVSHRLLKQYPDTPLLPR
jgi:hypothetical protein